ncbi:MAG: hypothetical protein IT367_10935 [Candidatus Hydrogenedentes bacterium]|nr:hypothetical protein [Candidatus Hydrogenedentota bacterium]
MVLDFKTMESIGQRDEWSVNAWLLSEDENTITVLEDDLRPKIYSKKEPTTIPSSWRLSIVKLVRVRDADFDAKLERLLVPEEQVPEGARVTRSSNQNETSLRCLAAYAAWKKNLSSYCAPIVQGDWYYQYEGADKFPDFVWEDLAWRHFERGVNLLMFADRSEVIEHLELSLALSPTADFGEDRSALVKGLRRINKMKPVYGFAGCIEPTGLDPFSRAKLYVWQLVDLRCVQTGQPGSVMPYASSFDRDSFLEYELPTTQLLSLGFAAVPALIAGLFDDSPTRTVFHWRDFARNRKVWKVSDFSRVLLGHVFIKSIFDGLAAFVLLSVIRSFYIRFAVSREVSSQTAASKHVNSPSTFS